MTSLEHGGTQVASKLQGELSYTSTCTGSFHFSWLQAEADDTRAAENVKPKHLECPLVAGLR